MSRHVAIRDQPHLGSSPPRLRILYRGLPGTPPETAAATTPRRTPAPVFVHVPFFGSSTLQRPSLLRRLWEWVKHCAGLGPGPELW